MTEIIKALEAATSLSIKPFGTDAIEDCICYSSYVISDNGAVKQEKLELRLITKTITEAERIKPIIISTLVTVGDNKKLNYLGCELNGGGTLKDAATGTIHTLLFFVITKKSEVKL